MITTRHIDILGLNLTRNKVSTNCGCSIPVSESDECNANICFELEVKRMLYTNVVNA